MKQGNKKALIAIIAFLLVLLVFLSGFLAYRLGLQPVSSQSETVVFEVAEGDSIGSVIGRLSDEGLIKSEMAAKIYAKLNGLHEIKAGNFQLDKAWDTGEILRYLNDSGNAASQQAKITVREGMWAKDIAKIFEEQLGISADELLALWNDEDYLRSLMEKYDFLDESILNDQTRVKLEGYLYPETYYFSMDATKEEITETFLDQFEQVYQSFKNDMKDSSLSLHELITLASLVQYEGQTAEDMKLIAGVFYNRLAIDMRLESSVTVCYALYEEYEHAEDCELNSNIDSPYNTYLNAGLPIGPILNPGKDAIDAALHPQESNYLYFMADIYGDGKVYYAETLEEHEQNVSRYLR